MRIGGCQDHHGLQPPEATHSGSERSMNAVAFLELGIILIVVHYEG